MAMSWRYFTTQDPNFLISLEAFKAIMPIKRVDLDNNLPKDCFDSWNAPVKIRISSATCSKN